ncbi:rhodanese-like domain-containing protein [Pseudonocardia kongjuensis]
MSHPQTDGTGPRTVSAADLRRWPQALVIDVRSAAEFEAQHIHGSYHVPLATLAEHAAELAGHLDDPASPLVLVCQSGVRAEQGRRHLAAAGLDRARVLDGGVPAYAAEGGHVVRGRTAWALERQVRLVAGSLVLTGILGGRFVSPKLRLLAGGIGTGLTFSALSNTCAMGAMLAKLPFNRDAVEPAPAAVVDRIRRREPGPVR